VEIYPKFLGNSKSFWPKWSFIKSIPVLGLHLRESEDVAAVAQELAAEEEVGEVDLKSTYRISSGRNLQTKLNQDQIQRITSS
jgi:hypothetical protein